MGDRHLPILPCAKCGDPRGLPSGGSFRPARLEAAKYGFPGKVCLRCNRQLYDQWRSAANLEKYGTTRLVAVRPCEACGATGGRSKHLRGESAKRPGRYRVVSESGGEILVCHGCRFPAVEPTTPRVSIFPGPESDPDSGEIQRLASEVRRQWSPYGAGGLVEPRYAGPRAVELAAVLARNAALLSIVEARAAERTRKAWKIVLPEPRA